MSGPAMENLKRYHFPGNLRELKNLIERAYILSSRDEIGVDEFPVPRGEVESDNGQPANLLALHSLPDSFDLTALLEQTEKDLIVRVLSATNGTQAEAARRMNLSRSALAYKLNKYGIRSSD